MHMYNRLQLLGRMFIRANCFGGRGISANREREFIITFRGKSVRSNCGPPFPPARTSCAALNAPDSAALPARGRGDPCTSDPACPPRGPKQPLPLVGCPAPSRGHKHRRPPVPQFPQAKSWPARTPQLGPLRTSPPGAGLTGAGYKNGLETRVNPRVWHRGEGAGPGQLARPPRATRPRIAEAESVGRGPAVAHGGPQPAGHALGTGALLSPSCRP